MSHVIKGIPASSGIAIAKAYLLVDPDLSFAKKSVENTDAEVERLESAIEHVKEQVTTIKHHVEKSLGPDKAAIFDAHLMILQDPEFLTPIKEKIARDRVNAEHALKETAQEFITIFESMDNQYMRERASDIRDVSKRILASLLDVELPNPGLVSEEVILVAYDLTPSDTAQLNKQYVKGFVTDIGGRTSHSAIMARSMEIPAIVGAKC